MGAMHEFLTRLESEPIRALYRDLDAVWERRAAELNARLQGRGSSRFKSPISRPSGPSTILAAVALQLDVPVLPASAGTVLELGRHRPAHLQPQLQ